MKVKYKISDIFDLQMGKTPSRDEQSFWNSNDYKWVAISDFDECKYIENTSEYISSQAVKNTGIKIVPKNTVIMSFKLSIGKVAITKEDMYTNEAIMAFFNKGVVNIELSYLYYLLKSYKWDLLAQRAAKGKSLNKEILNNATLCFHSNIQTQKEIVAVLDKVTSLISMRKEQLEKLDILVKSKFIEMFGDPVLNPKGWEKKKLGEVCSSIVRGPFGSALKKEYFVPYSLGVYKVYEQKNAIKQDCNIGSYYISEEKFLTLKRFECKAGDIIMSCSGTVGKMYTLPEDAHKGIINQALMKMTLNGIVIDKIFKIYFGLAVENLVLNGSGIKNISSVSYLKNIEIQAPPLDLQNQFAEFVEQVEKSKEKIKSSLNQLETLYSALMQEYFG